jgi:hypothetical protein
MLGDIQVSQPNPAPIVGFGTSFSTLATSVDLAVAFQPKLYPSFSMPFPFCDPIALQPNERTDTIGAGHPLASWLKLSVTTTLYQVLGMPFCFMSFLSLSHYFQKNHFWI